MLFIENTVSTAKPHLTQANATLTQATAVINEFGQAQTIQIPAERALTVYLDKRELVTLMTLGASPELLVLGFLRNQRLISSIEEIESITVDWSIGEGELGQPGVAAVKTRDGLIETPQAPRVVTPGAGRAACLAI